MNNANRIRTQNREVAPLFVQPSANDAGVSGARPVPEPISAALGQVFLDKYRIDTVLGMGGMGVVYSSTNLLLDQRVALKLLLPHAVEDHAFVARFAREAQILAKIRSEHVARVIDVGTCTPHGPFMVLEHLDGENLADLLDRDGAFEVETAVGYLLEACEAVAEAHSLGIVHRDLKPDNLFLARRSDGETIVKVLDFGISKVDAGVTGSLTSTTDVIGSPLYMSPEQLRASRDVDARSDVWSLGVTLYELLAGKGPFSVGSIPEVCAAVLVNAPRSLRAVQPGVPEELELVVMRCLEKSPEHRYANVAELADALAPFAPNAAAISCTRIAHLLQVAPTSEPATEGLPSFASPFDDTEVDTPQPWTHLRAPVAANEREYFPMATAAQSSRPSSGGRSRTVPKKHRGADRSLDHTDRRTKKSIKLPEFLRLSTTQGIMAITVAGVAFCAALLSASTPPRDEARTGLSSAIARVSAELPSAAEAHVLTAMATPLPVEEPSPLRTGPQLAHASASSAASAGGRKAPRQTRAFGGAHEATWGDFANHNAR